MGREGLSCPELVGEPGGWDWEDQRENNRDLEPGAESVHPIHEPNAGDTNVLHPVSLRLDSVPRDRAASVLPLSANLSVKGRFLLWPKTREAFQVLQATPECRCLWAVLGEQGVPGA